MLDLALCFNCDVRHNGTAYYLQRAMTEMASEADPRLKLCHYRPGRQVEKHDVYLYIDDGRDDITWIPPHPNAYYAIDTHLGFGYRAWKARHFDKVMCAQKNTVEEFDREEIKNAVWIPLAADPKHHICREEFIERGMDPETLKLEYEGTFVGFINRGHNGKGNDRLEYLDRLKREFKFQYSFDMFHEDMSLRYVKAVSGFNVSILHDLNMRVWEIMSMGVPCVTDRNVSGIDDFLTEDVHYIGFEGIEEAVEKIRWCLANQTKAQEIAKTAFELVRSKHTYKDRANSMLTECERIM